LNYFIELLYKMSLIKYTITFLAGIYIGQEYGSTIPSVKSYTNNLYDKFKQTEFYKQVSKDINKKT
jgi:hypothetical protein